MRREQASFGRSSSSASKELPDEDGVRMLNDTNSDARRSFRLQESFDHGAERNRTSSRRLMQGSSFVALADQEMDPDYQEETQEDMAVKLEERILDSLFKIGTVFFVIAYVCYFYSLEPELGWLDCLYFTMATFTTIGYGDIHPTSASSRIFTIFIVFISMLPVALALAATAEYLTTQENMKRQTHERQFVDAINSLHEENDDIQYNAVFSSTFAGMSFKDVQWEVYEGFDAFPGDNDGYPAPCRLVLAEEDDEAGNDARVLQRCQRECLERGCGGFVVSEGLAYFRRYSPQDLAAAKAPLNGAALYLPVTTQANSSGRAFSSGAGATVEPFFARREVTSPSSNGGGVLAPQTSNRSVTPSRLSSIDTTATTPLAAGGDGGGGRGEVLASNPRLQHQIQLKRHTPLVSSQIAKSTRSSVASSLGPADRKAVASLLVNNHHRPSVPPSPRNAPAHVHSQQRKSGGRAPPTPQGRSSPPLLALPRMDDSANAASQLQRWWRQSVAPKLTKVVERREGSLDTVQSVELKEDGSIGKAQANSRPSRLVTPTPSTPSTHYTPIQPSPSPLSPSSNLPRISPSNAKETSPAAKITASSRKDKNSSGGGDAPKVMGRTSGPSFGKSQKTGPLLMNLGKASLTAVAIALCWWLFDSEANLRSIKAAGHHHHAMSQEEFDEHFHSRHHFDHHTGELKKGADGTTHLHRHHAGLIRFMFVKAFYFATSTATTIGYGDVYPLTDLGKLLAVVYMPLSIGVFSGLLAAVAKATFRMLIMATCDAEGRSLETGHRLQKKATRSKRGERLVRGASQVRRWKKELFVERSDTKSENEIKIVQSPSKAANSRKAVNNSNSCSNPGAGDDGQQRDLPSPPLPLASRPRGPSSSSHVDTSAAAKALASDLAGIEEEGLDECEFMLYMLLILNKVELKSIRDVTVLMREHQNWKAEMDNLTAGNGNPGNLPRRMKNGPSFLQTFPDASATNNGDPGSVLRGSATAAAVAAAGEVSDLRVSKAESGDAQASNEPLVASEKAAMALETEQRKRTQQRSEFWPLLVAVIAVLGVALTVSLSCSLGEGEAFYARLN